MRRLRERSKPGAEDGFTAVELMVVIAIMGMVMAMVMSSVITTMQSQRRQLERLEALNEVKNSLHRVTRDLRGADPLVGPLEADRIEMTVVRHGEERGVTVLLDGDVLELEEVSTAGAVTHTLATGLDPAATMFRYFDAAGAELVPPAAVADVVAVEIQLRRILPEATDIEFRDRIMVRNARG